MRRSVSFLLAAVVTVAAGAVRAADMPLPAQLLVVQDGQISAAGETVTLRGAPGKSTTATLSPSSGVWDFSAYEAITLSLKNTSDQPITVRARAENPDAQKLENASQNAIELLGGQSKPFVLRLTRRPDDPTFKAFEAYYMYFKNLNVRDNTVDPAQISKLVITIEQWKPGQSLEIKSIAATGQGTPLPVPFFPFVDEYGQYTHGDWPGKIYRDSDFAERIKDEQRERANFPGPAGRNQYGGWADGPQRKATGFFRVEKVDGKWWLIDPLGRLFWSNATTGVGPGGDVTPFTERESWFVSLPDEKGPFGQFFRDGKGATYRFYSNKSWRGLDIQKLNNFRKYGDNYREEVAKVSHARLRSWGFNSIGNWSDSTMYLMHKTPYTVAVGSPYTAVMRGGDGHSMQDVYDPAWEPGMYANMEKQRGTTAGDPWCIGYFIDNERAIGWRERGSAIAEMALKAPATQPAKLKFIERLRGKYATIDALNKSWSAKYESWDALRDSRQAPSFKDNQPFTTDCGDFGMMFCERYFTVCRDAVKKVAPNNMFLGTRFYGHTDPAVVALAGKYWDLISYNIYDNPPTSRVNTYNSLDLPILATEWGVGSDVLQTPFRDAKLTAPTPHERAELIAGYLDAAIHHPNMVGAHFFQFRDQPLSGRPDGEATLRGYVNVADTPNFELIQTNRKFADSMYQTRYEAK
jgi:hypothetical protein